MTKSKTSTIKLNAWEIAALEAGLRDLIRSGKVHEGSAQELLNRLGELR
jgi:hypothetical protein